jgi:hypothetical protein
MVGPGGQVHCLYDESMDLAALGALAIRRASQVDADPGGRWWADLRPIGGPHLGPFPCRSLALAAERAWLEEHHLGRRGASPSQAGS